VPLPLELFYKYIPASSALQRPERLIFMLDVALIAGLAYLTARLRARSKAPLAVTALMLAALLLDFYSFKPEFRLVSVQVPEFYARLAREPGDFALLEAPLDPLPLNSLNARYGFYQTVHHKKTLNAMLIRPQMWLQFARFVGTQPVVAGLLHAGRDWKQQALSLAALRNFQQLGFKYLIVHTVLPREDQGTDPERRVGFDEGTLLDLQQLWGAPAAYPGGLLVFRLGALSPALKLTPGQGLNLTRHTAYPVAFADPSRPCVQIRLDLSSRRGPECRTLTGAVGPYRRLSFYLRAERAPFRLKVGYRDRQGRELLAPREIALPGEQSWTRVALTLPAVEAGSRGVPDLGTLVFGATGAPGGCCLAREVQVY
jgi:hypothetical protein